LVFLKKPAKNMAELRLSHMTPEQLFACCDAAHAHGELQHAPAGDKYQTPYQCSVPAQMTNEELLRLASLFSELLTKPALHATMMDTLVHKQPDGAAGKLKLRELRAGKILC